MLTWGQGPPEWHLFLWTHTELPVAGPFQVFNQSLLGTLRKVLPSEGEEKDPARGSL